MNVKEGWRGIVVLERRGRKTVAVKISHPRSYMNTLGNEAQMLTELNKVGIGPTLLESTSDKIVMEYVRGEPLGKFLVDAPKDKILPILRDIFRQCRILDEQGISKTELTRPYKDCIVKGNRAILLDFERARKSPNPKNVTQFCQFIGSAPIQVHLQGAGIEIEVTRIREMAKVYKDTPTLANFRKILSLVR